MASISISATRMARAMRGKSKRKGSPDFTLHQCPKWGDWDDYILEYRGRLKDICLSGCFKLVCGDDENQVNHELRFQTMQKMKEIDKEILCELDRDIQTEMQRGKVYGHFF